MHSSAQHSTPKRIGLMAELLGATCLEPMIGAAVDYLEAQGFETLVVSSGKSVKDEIRAWETLARSHCDGIIAHPDSLSNDRLSRLISTRKNVVLANFNNKLVGQLAAQHLLHLGHRHIAMVTGPGARYSVGQICEGFSAQIGKFRSGTIKFQVIEAAAGAKGGPQAMNMLLKNDAHPTAIFFNCDVMAINAMTSCLENAIRIPFDLSILGCGDLHEARHAPVPLSTIRQPLAEIGLSAATKVIRLVNNSKCRLDNATQESLQPELVVRQSVVDLTLASSKDADSKEQISKREQECLQWAAQGKTSWEISQILAVSESTVIYHLRNATRKLNAANRLHAVTKALKASIIDFR